MVQFEYHPASTEAAALAEALHYALNDDPAVPGLRIPTCAIPDDGTGAPPQAHIASEADRVVVVLLSDDYLMANARQPMEGQTWADYVFDLRRRCESSPNYRFVPVQLSERAWPIDPRLDDLNALRASTIGDGEDRRKFIARRLAHLLIRRLRPHATNEDAPPLTIFLSHTKLDLENEPWVVRSLLAHLTATQPEKTWFDSGDISTGSSFARAIERGMSDSALLAVVTDSYSSRAWCRREVLLAKRHQRPVVVIDAVQQREIRSFPYAGNVPVIRWTGDSQEVVDLLLREALRHAYAEEVLKIRKREGDDILSTGPELVTLVHRDRRRSILYPDPPLGPEEIAILEATGIRVETPLGRYARERRWPGAPLTIALSVSQAEDIARFGLRTFHLDAILLELSRYLLLSGCHLAYGGHLRPDSYTIRLADLLNDPVIDFLRGRPGEHAPSAQLVSYVPWPTARSVHDEARLGRLVEIRHCDRPADVDEGVASGLLSAVAGGEGANTAAQRYCWSRGLTEMRRQQGAECVARVVVGGRLGTAEPYYMGRLPGVLEEVVLAVQAQQPVYLVGAFGGCARLAIDVIQGMERPEMAWEMQRRVPFSDELRSLYEEHAQQWLDYDDIVTLLQGRSWDGLGNGLTVAENEELATARSGERIIELVLSGLSRLQRKTVTVS